MILDQLAKDGLLDKTIVMLLSDHGYKLHRDKQFLYEGGINMAFLVAGPGIAVGPFNAVVMMGDILADQRNVWIVGRHGNG